MQASIPALDTRPPFVPTVHDDHLTQIAFRTRRDYEGAWANEWAGSQFAWLRGLAPAAKSAAARDVLCAWLDAAGIAAEPADGPAATLRLGYRLPVAVKFSLRWNDGTYHFQQIRDGDYRTILLFAVSPDRAHLWAVPRDVALARSVPQHSDESRKLYFDAAAPPDWLDAYGGALDRALAVLRDQLARG